MLFNPASIDWRRPYAFLMTAVAASLMAAGCGGAQIGTVSDELTRRVPITAETGCGNEPSDSITISGVALRDRTLLIDVAHGGGCAEHTYRVCADDRIIETDPGQWRFTVLHEAHSDTCRAQHFRVLEVPVETTHTLVGLSDAIDGRSFTVLVE